MESKDAVMDAAIDGLSNWYDSALAAGAGFKSEEERQEYIKSLGDPMNHPMFATCAEDMEGHPMVEAIRQIREEDKTFVELALMYKDEGNEWMRKKDKKSLLEAYIRYTHALRFVADAESARSAGSEDPKDAAADLLQLRSQVLSNRAAVNLSQQNYGSCKKDANAAISAWSGNVKAHYRLCKAHFLLKDHAGCLSACAAALAVDPSNADLLALQESAQKEQQAISNKQIKQLDDKYKALKAIWFASWQVSQTVGAALGHCQLHNPEPQQLREHWPTKDQDGAILWPLLVLYPQYNQFDVIPDANVDLMLAEQLAMMFPDHTEAPPAPWDLHKEYELPNLVVYLQLTGAERISSLEQWMCACVESHVTQQSGSLDVAKYALKQINSKAVRAKYGAIDELTAERFNEIVQQADRSRTARLHEQTVQEQSQAHPPCSIMEVHMGCTLRRILSAVSERNALPRGVLSLFAFPRDNAAHKKFLKAAKADNKPIELLNPL